MAKREILFNDEVYSIEESVIETSLAEMKSRLVDDYSGSGTTIVYDGTTINVDSEKLATAASNLAATLNRFAGSGASIVVNGATYGIDSAKLSSAKENMSGTLGEMAGVVEEEDELAGTWVFNDSVEGIGLPGEQIIYNVNFASNNVTYNQIKLMEGNRLRIEDLAYNNTSVYNRTDGWVGEAYKTITITSKLSEFDDPTFIAWLQANATKQEESQIESVVGTWVFNDGGALDNLSNSTTPFDVEFMCNGKAYGSMKCDEDSGGEGMWSLYYVKTPTNIDEAYGWGIGWYDQTYRTINITSEPTDETFIAWLKANATKQGAASLISFTIDGTSYQAEEGMTWAEWCESDYNTGDYRLNGIWINKGGNGSSYVANSSGTFVTTSDTIISGHSYSMKSSGEPA